MDEINLYSHFESSHPCYPPFWYNRPCTEFYCFCEFLSQNYLRSWTWRNVLKLKYPSLLSQFPNLLQKQ